LRHIGQLLISQEDPVLTVDTMAGLTRALPSFSSIVPNYGIYQTWNITKLCFAVWFFLFVFFGGGFCCFFVLAVVAVMFFGLSALGVKTKDVGKFT